MTTPEEFSLVICTELEVNKKKTSKAEFISGEQETWPHSFTVSRYRQEAELICKGFLIHQLTQLEAGLGYYFLLYQKSIYIFFLVVGLLSSQIG